MTMGGEERDVDFAPMTTREREGRALKVLRTARAAARLLEDGRNPDELADQVQELWRAVARLLPELPDPVPLDADHQEEFIRCAEDLAKLLRAYNWPDEVLSPGTGDEAVRAENVGETGTAAGFDGLGKLTLPTAPAEGWAIELVNRAAEGNGKLERGVKVGKYFLHPTPLLILDDFTKTVGQAAASLHVKKLTSCVNDLSEVLKDGCLLDLLGHGPGCPEPPNSRVSLDGLDSSHLLDGHDSSHLLDGHVRSDDLGSPDSSDGLDDLDSTGSPAVHPDDRAADIDGPEV